MSIFGMSELIWIKVADYHSVPRSRAVRQPGRRLLASRGHCVVIDNVNQTGRAPGVVESDFPGFADASASSRTGSRRPIANRARRGVRMLGSDAPTPAGSQRD
jgi:hypothetical protein